MINSQKFFYPDKDLTINKDLAFPNVFPEGQTIQMKTINIKWTSILGEHDEEATINVLFNSPKFIRYIEKTREDFKSNHLNNRKYPKMDKNDWK